MVEKHFPQTGGEPDPAAIEISGSFTPQFQW